MNFDPNPPPPVPPVIRERRGPSCLLVGLVVAAVLVVILGLLGVALTFISYGSIKNLTSTAPAAARNIDAGDEVYRSAEEKGDEVAGTQAGATVEYTAEELNTLIARNPDFERMQIHLNVAMEGDRATLEASLPTSMIPVPISGLKDRYLNARASFGLGFDAAAKELRIHLHEVKIGADEFPEDKLPMVEAQFEPMLNQQLRNSPDVRKVLDGARNIEVRDGKLVIEMGK